jgi:hypothetical protein
MTKAFPLYVHCIFAVPTTLARVLSHIMPRVDEGVQFTFLIRHGLVQMSPNRKHMYRIAIEKHTTWSSSLWNRIRYLFKQWWCESKTEAQKTEPDTSINSVIL